MNREELIKEFDKQQLEILLNDLQDIDKFTGFKDGAFKYELGKYQANLLVNCIKKQKEVIDKAIEYIEDTYYSKNTTDIDSIVLSNNELLKIRKNLENKQAYITKKILERNERGI